MKKETMGLTNGIVSPDQLRKSVKVNVSNINALLKSGIQKQF